MRLTCLLLACLLLPCQVLLAQPGARAGQRPNAARNTRPGDLRMPDRIAAGDEAPDFTLQSPDGKREITLSSFRNKKPVALVFGSYT